MPNSATITASSAALLIEGVSSIGSESRQPEHLERDRRGQSEREVHEARRERALVLMRERTDGREHGDAGEGQP